MAGTTEPIPLTAEEKELLKPDPSDDTWEEQVVIATDEGKEEGEVRE